MYHARPEISTRGCELGEGDVSAAGQPRVSPPIRTARPANRQAFLRAATLALLNATIRSNMRTGKGKVET